MPENFNAFLSYRINQHAGEQGIEVLVTIECPVCLTQQFFQQLDADKEIIVKIIYDMKFSYSHNIFPHELCGKPMAEQSKNISTNLVELKNKYICNLQEVKE